MKQFVTIQLNPEELKELLRAEIATISKKDKPEQVNPQNKLLGVAEVALFLGLKESTIYGLTSRRKIPHYKPGKKLLFDRVEIEKWVLEHRCADVNSLQTKGKTFNS